MTREEFSRLTGEGLLFLDGATGTNLQKAGMPAGVCPELWILEHPEALLRLQEAFVEAGSRVLYAPTFGANRIKLQEYGLQDSLAEMNASLVGLSRQAAAGGAFVAGDITMTGRQLCPIGSMQFEELVEIYKEQIRALSEAGADLLVVETMMSLQETRAAVIAAREVCDLPVMATLTFESDGRSLFGTPPECVPVTLQGLGADAVGLNCSAGPDRMKELTERFYAYSEIPVIIKPNAGIPELESDRTVYRMTPEDFSESCLDLVRAGAGVIGGCCGTTPEHIRALVRKLQGVQPLPVRKERRRVICSERRTVEIIPGESLKIIGERINPTGKKTLQKELREGRLDLVRKMAREQEQAGASILDVNCGTGGIDEKQTMINVINEVSLVTDLPLCIDSSFPEVLEAALRIYPGRALINSISCEEAKFSSLIRTAQKYGAMFILLPVSDEGIPETAEARHELLSNALEKAAHSGIRHEDVIVDALAATVGADKKAALNCLETISFCRKRDLPTVCGLSNISFGLPERGFVNAAFLSMAILKGLTLAIANPMQDLLMNTAGASDLLMNREGSDLAYIRRMQEYAERKPLPGTAARTAPADGKGTAAASGRSMASSDNVLSGGSAASSGQALSGGRRTSSGSVTSDGDMASAAAPGTEDPERHPLFKAVLEGNKDGITDLAKRETDGGADAGEIINRILIPAINRVGELFDRKEYFLPQLIASANAMEEAIAFLEPMIVRDSGTEEAALVVIATVEGDVHDIGKNLVTLMLRNYGYRVIDLGKNVPAEEIIDTALKEDAAVVALSALMTTTMVNMKKVLREAKERHYKGKIIVGGAAVTETYARDIGADGYSTDAADCVRLVSRLLGRE